MDEFAKQPQAELENRAVYKKKRVYKYVQARDLLQSFSPDGGWWENNTDVPGHGKLLTLQV